MNRKIILLFGLLLASLSAPAQDRIETGAEQTCRCSRDGGSES